MATAAQRLYVSLPCI